MEREFLLMPITPNLLLSKGSVILYQNNVSDKEIMKELNDGHFKYVYV